MSEKSAHDRVKHFLQNTRDEVIVKKSKTLLSNGTEGSHSSKKDRQRLAMQRPKIYLLPNDDEKSENWLYFMDIQHLLLRSLGGPQFNARTRWCRLLRPAKLQSVVVVVVEQLEREVARTLLPKTLSQFEISINLNPVLTFGCSALDELVYTPVTHNRLAKLSLPQKIQEGEDDVKKCGVPRTALLLSASQMLAEGFPLPPPEGLDCSVYDGYRFSRSSFHPVTDASPLLAVDCEMCLTSSGLLELTRLSVVNEELECILDMLVKPQNEIQDYLTAYSGITSDMLANVKTTLQDAQNSLEKLLPPDAILCGHSLPSDLHALKIFHPYVIDTSVIFCLSGSYHNKSSLKKLAQYCLNLEIQSESRRVGHCSFEDALATMKLVQLKLSQDLAFGDFVAQSANSQANTSNANNGQPTLISCLSQSASSVGLISLETNSPNEIFYRHAANGRLYESLFGIADQCGRSSALISFDWPAPEASPPNLRLVRCIRDKHVARFARKILSGEESTYLTFVQMLGYGASFGYGAAHSNEDSSSSKEQDERLLSRLDKRLCSLLEKTPPNSLFITIFTGNTHSKYMQSTSQPGFSKSSPNLGLCCVKIT